MATVRKSKQFWGPRDIVPFFSENPPIWASLNQGEEVKIPDEVIPHLRGYVEIVEQAEPIKPVPIKMVKEKPAPHIVITENFTKETKAPDLKGSSDL
jgi:hypothetical protein